MCLLHINSALGAVFFGFDALYKLTFYLLTYLQHIISQFCMCVGPIAVHCKITIFTAYNTASNIRDMHFTTLDLQWPPNPPDLNPVDYKVWGVRRSLRVVEILGGRCGKRHFFVPSGVSSEYYTAWGWVVLLSELFFLFSILKLAFWCKIYGNCI